LTIDVHVKALPKKLNCCWGMPDATCPKQAWATTRAWQGIELIADKAGKYHPVPYWVPDYDRPSTVS